MQINIISSLKLEFFLAGKFSGKALRGASKPIIRIAIAAVALAIAVMIIALAIITGFQNEIREKVIGFGGHVQITSFDSNVSYEPLPIERNQPFVSELINDPEVRNVQVFVTKPGIIRTEYDIHGVVLKGVDRDFDWSFFSEKLNAGTVLQLMDTVASHGILISQKQANLLRLKIEDEVRMYFIIDDQIRVRKFTVEGIYETGLDEFDKVFVICDIRIIQRLNTWSENQVGGLEVLVRNYNQLDSMTDKVYKLVGYDLNAQSVKEIYPQIFDWLKLQDMNVIIVLVLMTLVAIITIISALLIIILEKTNTIGVFKALGYENRNIRKVFVLVAATITLKGMFWGNLLGLTLAFVQKHFSIISLNQESYYISSVPIDINWLLILLLNLCVLVISTLTLIVPSLVITSITPVKAIRIE